MSNTDDGNAVEKGNFQGRGRGGHSFRNRQQRSSRYDNKDKESDSNQKLNDVDQSSPVIKAFLGYQSELDAKHDKYERLLKKSRDLTIESKRIIFHLHRVTGDENKEKILEDVESRFKQLQTTVLKCIGYELIGEDFYHYIRAYSPGLQEYVEAKTFYHYLKDGRLIGLGEIQDDFHFTGRKEDNSCEETEGVNLMGEDLVTFSVVLTPMDYILGVADLTGELMRKCINSVGQGDLEEPFKLCHILQNIYDAFLIIGNLAGRELYRKTQVLKSSLQKVENACYTIRVRGTEIPKHMLVDVFSSGPSGPNFDQEPMDYAA